MREYSFTEIGMLSGAALGGIIGLVLFSASSKSIPYLLATTILATAAGIFIGKFFDSRLRKANRRDNDAPF